MGNSSDRKPDDSDEQQQRQRMLQQLGQTQAALQTPNRAPASVAPEENSWHQALRELPQDVMDTYSPSNMKQSAGDMYNSLKNYVGGNPADPHMNLQPNLPPTQALTPNQDQGMDPELFAKLRAQLQNK